MGYAFRPILMLQILCMYALVLPAEEPSSPIQPSEETAADGTISVVIPGKPTTSSGTSDKPNVATTTSTPPPQSFPVGEAAVLLSTALEPMDLKKAAPEDLYSRPLPLLEALERSGDRGRRLWITQAYWKVSSAFASVRFCTEAVQRLELIAPGGDPHDRAVLDVAVAEAKADLAEARAQLVATQQELVDLIGLPISESAPWPVDRPLATPYQTHFAVIFSNRPATGRIRAIDRMLPSKHEAIEVRAAAVLAARKALDMAETDHAKGKRPIESVASAQAALAAQQREFLIATLAYNMDIAEYAMAVADPTIPDDRFVSMLISTPIQWRNDSAISPASGSTPVKTPTP
ncbi:MAG: hypothetical protein ABGW78_06145 [Pirellulales bacterium]